MWERQEEAGYEAVTQRLQKNMTPRGNTAREMADGSTSVDVVQTHLVHVTGPLHNVLEGAFAGDVVHQEDSLDGRRKEDKQKRKFSVILIWKKASISICFHQTGSSFQFHYASIKLREVEPFLKPKAEVTSDQDGNKNLGMLS